MRAGARNAQRAEAPQRAARSGEETGDVLIIDDHPVVLNGFRRILEDLQVGRIHAATDIVSGYRLYHTIRPPIAVIDLSFQDRPLAGLSLIRRIRAFDPDAKILAFSMYDDPVVASRAIEAGSLGYVLKDASAAMLVEAFEAVRAGQSFLERRLATSVAMMNISGHARPLGRLNARELQILSLLSDGKSYSVIADRLSVSYRTVIGACSNIRQKLGVRTLAELIHVAVSQNSTNIR